ncbi:MAG TPA: hypothetical protein DIW52_10650, partial [Pseudomonas sp.]|nr:hypothetical protein [Pseudomonas sp.]
IGVVHKYLSDQAGWQAASLWLLRCTSPREAAWRFCAVCTTHHPPLPQNQPHTIKNSSQSSGRYPLSQVNIITPIEGLFFARRKNSTIRRKLAFFSCFKRLCPLPGTTIDSYSAILQNVALFYETARYKTAYQHFMSLPA